MLNAISVRFTDDDSARIESYARERGYGKAHALRELVRLGHEHREDLSTPSSTVGAQVHAGFTELTEQLDQLTSSLSELHDTVAEIASALSALNSAFAKVWVESLMANRLLLDAHHRGLVERAREMTSRYLERGRSASGAPEDPS
jgi:hypothetical protein